MHFSKRGDSVLPSGSKESESIRVLLVEADPVYSRELRSLIEEGSSGQCEVYETTGVEPALTLLLEQKFDVLLLDLSLPDSEGLDTLSRAKGATASVPVVALTNDENEEQAVDVLRLGAQEHLLKSQLDARSLAAICATPWSATN